MEVKEITHTPKYCESFGEGLSSTGIFMVLLSNFLEIDNWDIDDSKGITQLIGYTKKKLFDVINEESQILIQPIKTGEKVKSLGISWIEKNVLEENPDIDISNDEENTQYIEINFNVLMEIKD